ncbi:MAG: (2Fe-2S)-binding protein [Alphaproteobacteria bacterium]
MRRIETVEAPTVVIEFEGRDIQARQGDSVAAALIAVGEVVFCTSPVTGAERGPFCMMGVCFECMVEIDGAPNRQACLTPVESGMRVRRQRGSPALGPEASAGGETP